jgi:hypothetical protein
MRNKLIIVIFFSLFTFAFTATAQKLIDSPYSRFNLGSLQPAGSFRSLSMGGVGTAMRDNSSVYYTNPASYSSFDTISFVFDFGLDYGKNYINGATSKFKSDDINFHHLVLGFPLSKGWGFAVGIFPITSGYYNITSTIGSGDPGYDPNVGGYTVTHTGDGGINKFFFGTGLKIMKNLSVGANMYFLSGQLRRTNQFVFTDYYNVFHNNNAELLHIKGVGADFGLQYMASFKNNYFLNAGVSFSLNNNFSTKYNQLSEKYSAYGVSDTISFVSDPSAKTYIPGALSVGISFGKKNKFTTGIDYTATKWSAAKIPGSTGYAADTKTISFGGEFIPDRFSNYNLLSRMEYRIGAHFGDNYLIINGQQVKEKGASIGLGIPLRRTWNKINLYLDFTRKSGYTSTSIRNEDYLTMGLSLNLYDNWFLKRKYE